MNKQEFIAEIAEVMEMEDEELRGEDALEDLADWDSMAVMGFIAMVDSNFGTTIKAAKINECKTVNDLVALVEDKLSA